MSGSSEQSIPYIERGNAGPGFSAVQLGRRSSSRQSPQIHSERYIGEHTPLPSEGEMDQNLFFTEHDRRAARRALADETSAIPFPLKERFSRIADTAYSHQAEYFLETFALHGLEKTFGELRERGIDAYSAIEQE